METTSVDNTNPVNNPTSSTVEADVDTRIQKLENALTTAKKEYEKAKNKHFWQTLFWIIACIIISVLVYRLARFFYKDELPDYWTWQVLYTTTFRIAFLSGAFAIGAFCFKILRSHIHIYHHIQHKLMVVNSMASFVEAATTPEQRNKVFSKILDILTRYSNTGIISKENNISIGNDLIDILKQKKT